jgi:ABC-type enterochelin transport system permease subunit
MPAVTQLRDLPGVVRTNKDLRREAYSMSIYVAIILLSALSVFDDDHPPEQGQVFLLELGTTVGLVLAHGFASWVSATVIGESSEEVDEWDLLRAQLFGALSIAALGMLAAIIAPTSSELSAVRFTVAATIGALVFLESRATNTFLRAAVYGLLALVAGVSVAAIKTFLAH